MHWLDYLKVSFGFVEKRAELGGAGAHAAVVHGQGGHLARSPMPGSPMEGLPMAEYLGITEMPKVAMVNWAITDVEMGQPVGPGRLFTQRVQKFTGLHKSPCRRGTQEVPGQAPRH